MAFNAAAKGPPYSSASNFKVATHDMSFSTDYDSDGSTDSFVVTEYGMAMPCALVNDLKKKQKGAHDENWTKERKQLDRKWIRLDKEKRKLREKASRPLKYLSDYVSTMSVKIKEETKMLEDEKKMWEVDLEAQEELILKLEEEQKKLSEKLEEADKLLEKKKMEGKRTLECVNRTMTRTLPIAKKFLSICECRNGEFQQYLQDSL